MSLQTDDYEKSGEAVPLVGGSIFSRNMKAIGNMSKANVEKIVPEFKSRHSKYEALD